MDLSTNPKLRPLCAELLEGRWLLSGVPLTFDVTPSGDLGAAALSVIEDAPAEEEGDADVAIAWSDLPPAVLAAFNVQFPLSEIIEAEVEVDEGQTLYGVTTARGEREIDVMITPDGTITEIETKVSFDQLPQDVQDLFRQRKGDASVTEAGIVRDLRNGAEERFEILYTSPGYAPHEMVAARELRSTDPGEKETVTLPEPSPATPEVVNPRELLSEPSAAEAAQQVRAVARAERTTTYAGAEGSERDIADARSTATSGATPSFVSVLDPSVTQALDALAAGAGASVWLPEVAGLLVDVLPLDVAAIERDLQQMLNEFGSLAQEVTRDATISTGISRVAMAAALVAAVKVLLLQSKKPIGTTPLVFGSANSSWSWVLGTTAPRRRRITLTRQSGA